MKLLLCLTLLVAASGACAQEKGKATLYGFVQSVSKGTQAEPVGGGGIQGVAGRNYQLYAVTAGRIYPSEIWVQGVRYGVMPKPVKLPVEYRDENNIGSPAKVLVPKTPGQCTLLVLRPAATAKAGGVKGRQLASTNELVLLYKLGGRVYYNTLENLSPLDAAAMQ